MQSDRSSRVVRLGLESAKQELNRTLLRGENNSHRCVEERRRTTDDDDEGDDDGECSEYVGRSV